MAGGGAGQELAPGNVRGDRRCRLDSIAGCEGGWSDWESLGSLEGQEATWVAAIQTRERSLRLFTGRSDLFQRWQIPGGGWSRWIPLDNPPRIRLIQAAVALNAKGQLELWFTIQDTMDLYRLKQTLPNGTEWSGERSFA